MSRTQSSLDAWSESPRREPECDPVVEEYVIGSPELPVSIGEFSLRRGPTFHEDYAVHYEDDSGQSVSARWSSRHQAYVVRVDVDDEPHGYLRRSGGVGGLLTAGERTIDHESELEMYANLVEFVENL